MIASGVFFGSMRTAPRPGRPVFWVATRAWRKRPRPPPDHWCPPPSAGTPLCSCIPLFCSPLDLPTNTLRATVGHCAPARLGLELALKMTDLNRVLRNPRPDKSVNSDGRGERNEIVSLIFPWFPPCFNQGPFANIRTIVGHIAQLSDFVKWM